MGDRASVIIKQNDKQGIEIYGHWAGIDIIKTLSYALQIAEERFDDISYFNRIIIQNILNNIADANKSTSAGIEICDWNESNHGDLNNHPVFINPFERIVSCRCYEYDFQDIIDNGVGELQNLMKFEED